MKYRLIAFIPIICTAFAQKLRQIRFFMVLFSLVSGGSLIRADDDLALGEQPAILRILGDQASAPALEELADRFMQERSDVNVIVEARDGGVSRENHILTRLRLNSMHDLFTYSVGASMHILEPDRYLLDLSDASFSNRIDPVFRLAASKNGAIYAMPLGSSMSGGVLYNRAIYERLSLRPPQDWAEFLRNNQIIRDAGVTPIAFSLATSWSSQVPFLADFGNFRRFQPTFSEQMMRGETIDITLSAAAESFDKMQELADKGLVNSDAPNVTHEQAVRALAMGMAGHMITLTFALEVSASDINGSNETVGFFPIPPRRRSSRPALTIWMPQGLFVSRNTEKPDLALEFLAFSAEPEICAEGLNLFTAGPPVIDGCGPYEAPNRVVEDLAGFYETSYVTPALEFLTPLKGPSLEVITTKLLLGQINAKSALAEYRRDLEIRAVELTQPD